MSLEDEVEAHWEGVNGGPYMDANDLLRAMQGNTSFNSQNLTPTMLSVWITNAKGARLDEVAAVISDMDVPSMKRDLIRLRDELAEDEP